MAAAVIEVLGATGVDVETEIQPLMVAGRLSTGPWAGLPIVTKGGLVGDGGAVPAAVGQLRAAQRRRSDPARVTGEVQS
jgi:uncharacterized protein YgbK (DUF1537 family)